jgi:hypothetical protein
MIDSDIIYTILRTIPESIMIIFSGFILLGIKKDKLYILRKGILLGIIVSIIRKLPISFGIHTVLSMIIVGAILFIVSKDRLLNSIIATCQIWIALSLSEAIYIMIATKIIKIPFAVLTNNIGIKGALTTLPSLVIFLGLSLLFNKIQNKTKKILKEKLKY